MTSIPKGTWTCAFACTLSSMELHFLLHQGDKLLIILHYPPLTASPKLPCTPLSWVAIFHFSASLGFILTTINTSFLSHNIYLLSSHSDFFCFEEKYHQLFYPHCLTQINFSINICWINKVVKCLLNEFWWRSQPVREYIYCTLGLEKSRHCNGCTKTASCCWVYIHRRKVLKVKFRSFDKWNCNKPADIV